MDITLNEPVKPLGSDDFIFTVTEISDTPMNYGDILNITLTLDSLSETYDAYISQTDTDESRYAFIKLLVQSVAKLSTVHGKVSGRFSSRNSEELSEFKVTFNSKAAMDSNSDIESQAEIRRLSGNNKYSIKNYADSVKNYKTALELLDKRAGSELCTEIYLKCNNNLSACLMQLSDYDGAVQALEKVESIDPDNIKMLWRMGNNYLHLGKFEKSEVYLKKALNRDPDSKVIQRDLELVNEKLKHQKNQSRKLAEQMFANVKKEAQSTQVQDTPAKKREIPKPPKIERETPPEDLGETTVETVENKPKVKQKLTSTQSMLIAGGLVVGLAAVLLSRFIT